MKTLKILTLSCMLLLAFGCSKDDLRSTTEYPQTSEEVQTRAQGTTLIGPYDNATRLLIEWDLSSNTLQRALIRQENINTGYLISWEACPYDPMLRIDTEVWLVNPDDCGCQRPIRRPDTGGDGGRVTIDGTCD